LDATAAGSRQLNEAQALAILRVALEEALERPESLGQALGVVDSLHPDPEQLDVETQLREETLPPDVARLVHEFPGHADGIGFDVGGVVAAHDREPLAVDPRLERAVHRFQKVVAVVLGVEADDVGPEHPEKDLPLPGADAEGLEVGPRNVPED